MAIGKRSPKKRTANTDSSPPPSPRRLFPLEARLNAGLTKRFVELRQPRTGPSPLTLLLSDDPLHLITPDTAPSEQETDSTGVTPGPTETANIKILMPPPTHLEGTGVLEQDRSTHARDKSALAEDTPPTGYQADSNSLATEEYIVAITMGSHIRRRRVWEDGRGSEAG
jgi:hypothetical protein